jgi:flagellar biosynthesis anti-sigma factor FlgM
MSNPVDSAVYKLTDRCTDTPCEEPDQGTSSREASRSSGRSAAAVSSQAPNPFEQAVGSSPEFDAYRVAKLKEALFRGQYRVDAKTIAEKLLAMESKLP